MRSQYGFTLIELLVTMVIMAIVAAIAVPSYTVFLNRQSVQGEANAFALDIRYARSEAARRNTRVLICASANGTSCSGNWADKRIVFTDRGTQGVVDGTDTVMRSSSAPKSSVTLTPTGFPTAGRLAIRPTGQPEAAVAMVFCRGAGGNLAGKQLSVSLTGKPSITDAACASN